ncbi:MAG TPA: B12-binding domain-containing radical SAM protein [Candidatus Acidoferrales bacterium]|nr:B12-binding domain-containing radical SAM protein [Candidatus Acidoferrales bacterium]
MNILLLYPKFPEETFWNTSRSVRLLWGRKAIMPPLGLLTIASYLPEDFSLRLVDRNVCEESESDWEWADVVFVSLMIAQREDYSVCLAKARSHRKPLALGGPFTHAFPEIAGADADWVCFGEAETIMAEFVDDLRAGRRGKQYHGGARTDMENTRVPRFDLLGNVKDYATMALQFSRGCPFRCEFCDVIEIYGRVPRAKTPAQVCAELTALKKLGFSGYIFLVDDNFIGNKKKAKALLERLAAWNRQHGHPFRYYTEASINLADDDELIEGLRDSGFFHVFIGVETPDPRLLKKTLKLQNVPGNPLEKLRKIRESGIHVIAGFIIGFDGEDKSVFATQKGFIQASGVGVAMVGLLQAIPHTQLWRRLKSEGRLLARLEVHGNLTIEGINFVPHGPLTKRQYLERYTQLLQEIYDPRSFFERALTGLVRLKAKLPPRALWRHGGTLLVVLLKELYHFGVRDKRMRKQFRKSLFLVLWKNPRALEAFVFDCSVFYHLQRHANYIRAEIAGYLGAPSPFDALDETASGDRRRTEASA